VERWRGGESASVQNPRPTDMFYEWEIVFLCCMGSDWLTLWAPNQLILIHLQVNHVLRRVYYISAAQSQSKTTTTNIKLANLSGTITG
jgi:hypothetical protein